jgi:hypothetical protein
MFFNINIVLFKINENQLYLNKKNMNQDRKAAIYGDLLNTHTRIGNQISEIKGQSIELNQEQIKNIRMLENQQLQVMSQLRGLFE